MICSGPVSAHPDVVEVAGAEDIDVDDPLPLPLPLLLLGGTVVVIVDVLVMLVFVVWSPPVVKGVGLGGPMVEDDNNVVGTGEDGVPPDCELGFGDEGVVAGVAGVAPEGGEDEGEFPGPPGTGPDPPPPPGGLTPPAGHVEGAQLSAWIDTSWH